MRWFAIHLNLLLVRTVFSANASTQGVIRGSNDAFCEHKGHVPTTSSLDFAPKKSLLGGHLRHLQGREGVPGGPPGGNEVARGRFMTGGGYRLLASDQTLEGLFSAVWTATIATKYSLFPQI